VRHERRPGPPLELGGERARDREDVGDDQLGIDAADQLARDARRLDGGRVGLERPLASGEDLVLRGRREADALALGVVAPAVPGLESDVVAAARQLGAEGDRREGVSGIAEGGEQEAAPAFAQSISASSRTMRVRCSTSWETTLTIIVPTPASP
jgi:hypothetical protein